MGCMKVRLLEVVERSYLVARRGDAAAEALARHIAQLLSAEPCSEEGPAGSCCRVYLWARPPRECLDSVFFVVVESPTPRFSGRLSRLVMEKLAPGLYVVYARSDPARRVYVRIREKVEEVEPPCPRRLLEELAEHADVGSSLPIRDAVDIVASMLGIGRGEARELIASLAKRLCLAVKNGRVYLLQ